MIAKKKQVIARKEGGGHAPPAPPPREFVSAIGAVKAWNKIQTAFGDAISKNLATIQMRRLY